MKKIKIFLSIPLLMLLFSSCTVQQKIMPAAPYSTSINFDMDDLEYLGEVSGTSTKSYFLFIPYGSDDHKSAVLVFPGNASKNMQTKGFKTALYNALLQQPEADFVIPLSVDVTKNIMFMGKEEITTVKAKAFKLKVE
jgi:uncharacterized protein DUF6567